MNLIHALIASILCNSFFVALTFLYPGWIRIAVAKMQNKKLIFVRTKDNVLTIRTGKRFEGAYRTKTGVYELEPGEEFTFNGTKSGEWYEAYNRAVNPAILPFVKKLRAHGIRTYSQLENLMKIDITREDIPESVKEIVEIARDPVILGDLEVIRPADLKDYLESRSPAVENSIIEREVQKERARMQRTMIDIMPWVIGFVVLLVGAAFAFKALGTGQVDSAAGIAQNTALSNGIALI